MLKIRKLADTTDGERVVRHHPITGERMLVRPDTLTQPDFAYEQLRAEPWPLAGITIEGDVPQRCAVATGWVAAGRHEGWLTVEGETVAHRPGGPAQHPWAKTHSFVHLEAIVLHTVDGDVRYRVTRQPDKYVAGNDTAAVTDEIYAAGETQVDWTYHLELEN